MRMAGRIIGDYRRVALYGVNVLIRDKDQQMASLDSLPMDESVIRQREELSEQIRALTDLKTMAERYGYDISGPALNAREAVQWTYFLSGRGQKNKMGRLCPLVGLRPSWMSILIVTSKRER